MWAIQLLDGKRWLVFLREYILDGRILVFDKEEVALRFMNVVKNTIETNLKVRLSTVRYSSDPRKDKPYKVPNGKEESLAEYICSLLG